MSLYYTWKNVKEECNNNKLKITAPTWDETCSLLDGSYLVADIQDYFLHIIKEHEPTIKNSEESPVLIYESETENRITFKIKSGYKLELLTNETMKLLGDHPIIDQDKNSSHHS